MTDHITATVANHCAELIRLATDLPDQAEHQANSRVIMGGAAMGELGHVANLEAWGYLNDAAEGAALEGRRSWPTLEHEDDTDEPALQLLLFWTESARREWGVELDVHPTIASEAQFIRFNVERLWDTEPKFNDLADDVRKAKTRLENVLRAGHRDEPSRVHCDRDQCDTKPRLIRVVGKGGREDRWKCTACRTWYDTAGFAAAYEAQMRKTAQTDRYMPHRDAALVLVDQGTPDRVSRAWLEKEGYGSTEAYCDLASGRTYLRWQAMWTWHRARVVRLAIERKRRADKASAA